MTILKASNVDTPIHILHVDDDLSIQEITKLMLLDLDSSFKIDNACCVDEAFKKFAVGNYDVVVSDFDMPEKTGLQFLQELREQKNDIPFILFTGKGREEVAIKALNLGADGYINKQGDPETVYGELSHSIQNSVERKKAQALLLRSEIQLQCMLDINKMLDASDKELIDYALEAITKVTLSKFAFIGLINQDETEMTIHSWSKNAMKECNTISKPIHYPISKAGVWAEPIRQRKPIFIDDYSASVPCKKGLPQGHVGMERFLGVPVFEKEHIVAIAAVANKKEHYDQTNVSHITSLLTDMWRLIQRKKSTELLAKSESKYHDLVENSLQGISILQAAPIKLVFANGAFGKILGYSSEELISLSPEEIMSLVYHEDRAVFFKRMENRLRGEPAGTCYEFRAVRKDGSLIWLSSLANRVDYDGQPAVQGMFLDISERKKVENEVKQKNETLEKVTESIGSGLAVIDKDYCVVWANKQLRDLGVASNKKCYQTFNKSDTICPDCGVKKVIEQNVSLDVHEFETVNSKGETVWIELRVTPLRDKDGKVTAAIELAVPITERKKAELELKQYIQVLEKVGEGIDAGLAVINRDYRIVWANKRMTDLGIATNKKCYETHNTLGIVCPDCGVEKIFEQNASRDVHEYKKVDSKGETTWVEIRVTPLKDKDGNITAALELALPITERKKKEAVLQESEARQRAISALIVDVVFSCVRLQGENFAVDWITGAIEKVFNCPVEEIKNRGCWKHLVHPQDLPIFDEKVVGLSPGQSSICDLRIISANGTIRWVRVYSRVEEDKTNPTRHRLFGACENITERKDTELALQENELKFRTVADSASYWVYWTAPDGSLVYVSPSCERITGYTTEEFIKEPKLLQRIVTPQDAEIVGSHFDLSDSEEEHAVEFRIRTRRGETIWISHVCKPVFDVKGKWRGRRATNIDITERKKAEEHQKVLERKVEEYSKHLKCMVDLRTVQLKDANERLVKSERLAAIGELAGMVGHDLRNPLAGIKNAAYFLKKKGSAISESETKEMLETIDKGIDHSDKIINDLLDYAREIHLKLTKHSARTLIEEALKMIQVPDRIQILNHVHEETWIWVNSDKMMRVFINIIKNAIDAMPGKGVLKISCCQTRDQVEIAFADTGSGIPEETLKKLFTPLFTTKALGTGFGLAICKRVIDAHEGTITVKTAENKGTTFTVMLPHEPKIDVEYETCINPTGK